MCEELPSAPFHELQTINEMAERTHAATDNPNGADRIETRCDGEREDEFHRIEKFANLLLPFDEIIRFEMPKY